MNDHTPASEKELGSSDQERRLDQFYNDARPYSNATLKNSPSSLPQSVIQSRSRISSMPTHHQNQAPLNHVSHASRSHGHETSGHGMSSSYLHQIAYGSVGSVHSRNHGPLIVPSRPSTLRDAQQSSLPHPAAMHRHPLPTHTHNSLGHPIHPTPSMARQYHPTYTQHAPHSIPTPPPTSYMYTAPYHPGQPKQPKPHPQHRHGHTPSNYPYSKTTSLSSNAILHTNPIYNTNTTPTASSNDSNSQNLHHSYNSFHSLPRSSKDSSTSKSASHPSRKGRTLPLQSRAPSKSGSDIILLPQSSEAHEKSKTYHHKVKTVDRILKKNGKPSDNEKHIGTEGKNPTDISDMGSLTKSKNTGVSTLSPDVTSSSPPSNLLKEDSTLNESGRNDPASKSKKGEIQKIQHSKKDNSTSQSSNSNALPSQHHAGSISSINTHCMNPPPSSIQRNYPPSTNAINNANTISTTSTTTSTILKYPPTVHAPPPLSSSIPQTQIYPASSKPSVFSLTPQQVMKSMPNDGSSCIFHIFDRRINFDNHHPKAKHSPSFYSLLRSWVQDDPYRITPPPFWNLMEYSNSRFPSKVIVKVMNPKYATNKSSKKRKIVDICSLLTNNLNKPSPEQNDNFVETKNRTNGPRTLLAQHVQRAKHLKKQRRNERKKMEEFCWKRMESLGIPRF